MPVRLLMNHNVDRAVTEGLRLRGVDVLTAYDDGSHELEDPQLLDRAAALSRVVFSTDGDLVVEARRRQKSGEYFAGVIFARQQRLGIGQQIEQLELLAKTCTPEELANELLFLWRS
ncbi:MAG: DUF5615 family PIN-like protein [Thermoanaerobaculia bacterium]